MSDTKSFTPFQLELVSQLVQCYGIEPTEITFFPGDPKPFIGYEATCVMCNALVPEMQEISIDPVAGFASDSLALKCTLRFTDGRIRSATGVANTSEPGEGGEVLSGQQVHQLASSRAIRNALRTAGIDLIKLHQSPGNVAEFTGPSNRNSLLAQAHALGTEVGYIAPNHEKSAWRRFLQHRYGVTSSQTLSEDMLADLIAVLRSIRQPVHKVAA